MKTFYLFKSIPFLSSLLIIIFLYLNNTKDNTNLKILIWNTPKSTLGTYLAVSTGSGFILSYIITSRLLKNNQSKEKEDLNYNLNKDFSNDEYIGNNISYCKNLIERDIKQPSPTVIAKFRVIGRTNKNIEPTYDYQNDIQETHDNEEYKDINPEGLNRRENEQEIKRTERKTKKGNEQITKIGGLRGRCRRKSERL